MKTHNPSLCPIIGLLHLLGKRRVIIILKQLLEGKNTFNSIQKATNGISPKVLTDRLDELVASGIVMRKIISEKPRKIRYSLSTAGIEIKDPVLALAKRAERNFTSVHNLSKEE